jgi:hypothetical protein
MVDVRGQLTAESRAVVADYWWTRATGELTSWVGWGHVLADLRACGSPQPVLELAERAVEDEYRHAMWCRDWAVRFGHPGRELVPRGERPITIPGLSEAENRLFRIALVTFTETVGCFVLRHVRPVVQDPELRALNRRHMADELQHSRTGWAHLSTLSPRDQGFVREALPRLFDLLGVICCKDPGPEREDLVPFGAFTPRVLKTAHDDAVASVIVPGLAHLGLTQAA